MSVQSKSNSEVIQNWQTQVTPLRQQGTASCAVSHSDMLGDVRCTTFDRLQYGNSGNLGMLKDPRPKASYALHEEVVAFVIQLTIMALSDMDTGCT